MRSKALTGDGPAAAAAASQLAPALVLLTALLLAAASPAAAANPAVGIYSLRFDGRTTCGTRRGFLSGEDCAVSAGAQLWNTVAKTLRQRLTIRAAVKPAQKEIVPGKTWVTLQVGCAVVPAAVALWLAGAAHW